MADYFWSRIPGKFLDKTNGAATSGASFVGTIREWYETLIEVMTDVTQCAVRENGGKPMTNVSWRGDANVILITQCSVLFKPLTLDEPLGTIGLERSGVICNIPIRSDGAMYMTGKLELLQWEGSPAETVIGTVTVQDFRRII